MLCAFWFVSTHETFIPCGLNQVMEKTIAARRNGVKTIILPLANKRDFNELAPNLKEGLHVHYVDDYSEILEVVFRDD